MNDLTALEALLAEATRYSARLDECGCCSSEEVAEWLRMLAAQAPAWLAYTRRLERVAETARPFGYGAPVVSRYNLTQALAALDAEDSR